MVYRLASPGQLTGAVRHQGISAFHAFELALLGHPSGLALTVLDDLIASDTQLPVQLSGIQGVL